MVCGLVFMAYIQVRTAGEANLRAAVAGLSARGSVTRKQLGDAS